MLSSALVLALLCLGGSLSKSMLGPLPGFAPLPLAVRHARAPDTPVLPSVPLKHMDPVDACLFACNMCYRDSLLMKCVNKLCLGQLAEGAVSVDRMWLKTCPGLKLLLY